MTDMFILYPRENNIFVRRFLAAFAVIITVGLLAILTSTWNLTVTAGANMSGTETVQATPQFSSAEKESIRLAEQANGLLGNTNFNVETAALLSIRALKTAYTAEADEALAKALDRSNVTLQLFRGHTDVVQSVAFVPDGKTVLTGSIDQTARLWDVASRKRLHTFEWSYRLYIKCGLCSRQNSVNG
ncbi:MAG: WD40 repeat domain-containing protein [Chloroflexota bacterium]